MQMMLVNDFQVTAVVSLQLTESLAGDWYCDIMMPKWLGRALVCLRQQTCPNKNYRLCQQLLSYIASILITTKLLKSAGRMCI